MPTNGLQTYDQLVKQVDMVALDARAVRASVKIVSQLTEADLSAPTPCGQWSLTDLLVHMTAQHNGFAAAAAGGSDPAEWKEHPLGDAPIEMYRRSAERVVAAFSASDVLEQRFALPDFSTETTFSAGLALCAHFIDYVVHSWDVAKTLGVPVEFEADLLEIAVAVAEAVPGGEARLAPGAAFGVEVDWAGGSDLDRIVAMLGRSPGWES
jgi:uncharacterized protein (TIGR03086 family)